MTKTVYNIDKLQRTGELDAKEAVTSFGSVRAYSDFYTAFIEGASKHLQFLPDVIVYVDVTRNMFIEEAEELKKSLLRIGAKKTYDMIDDLINETNKGNSKAVSDRLVQYRAKIELFKKAAADSATISEEKPFILAVDDMPEVLAQITEILSETCDVAAVSSAKDALKAAVMHIPDVFLLDIEMPDEDGVTLANELRADKLFAKTPVFFLTSSSKKEHVISAKGLGCSGYILKPIAKKSLLKRLSDIKELGL